MYGINVIYTMKPGKREEFLAGVTASGAQAAVRGEEGCLAVDNRCRCRQQVAQGVCHQAAGRHRLVIRHFYERT